MTLIGRYWFDQGLVDAARRGSLVGFALGSCFRSQAAFRVGELAVAEADARSALAAAGEDRWVSAPAAIAYLVDALIERGELGEARALLGRCEIQFGLDHTGMSHWVPYARGQLALASGEWELAAQSFEHCRVWFTAWGERNPGLLDWRTGAALAHAKLGERDRARELTGEVVALSRSLGQPRCLGVGLRAAGIVQGGADGIDLLREAVTVLVGTPARLEHARALIDLGAALRRQNHRKDARAPLRAGIDLADRCGAGMLARRGQDELIATGARPRRIAASGADSLTPSERRVAQLAADGLSSPQVAQQLFVTVNTVESHLRRAYMKLDIHSRGELAGALATERTGAVRDSASRAAPTAMASASPR
jgi:DNA-binding CsgD family transcriptional regulator